MPRELPIRDWLTAIVDDDDHEWLAQWKWSLMCGRAARNATNPETGKTRPVYMHREIMAARRGLVVDHLNGDPLDNRRQNLRVCSQGENCRNLWHHRPPGSGRFITIDELSRDAGMSRDKIMKALWAGKIRSVNSNGFLILRSDAAAWLSKKRLTLALM